jgi:hypothetical protein
LTRAYTARSSPRLGQRPGISLERKHRRDSREPRRLVCDGTLDFVVQSAVTLKRKVQSKGA